MDLLCWLVLIWPQAVVGLAVTQRFFGNDLASRPLNLRHMDRHSASGQIYAAGRNVLLRLDANLTLLQTAHNGPALDSPFCNRNGDCIWTPGKGRSARTLTDNYNQILLVDDERSVLIVCGTLFQGACAGVALSNVSQVLLRADDVPVAANLRNASTAAFLGPSGGGGASALYVGASFTHDAYREHVPAVCSRAMEPRERAFQLLDPGDITGQSGMMLKIDHKQDFPIRYVGGFVDNGHVHWLAVQRESLEPTSPLRSKLLRVCASDVRFDSYAEVPLECLGRDNSNYNLLSAFRYVPAAAPGNSAHLLAVFERSPMQSALCVFPIDVLRSAFRYNVQRCSSGIDRWNLPQYGLNMKCHNVSSPGDDDDHARQECAKIRVGGTIPATSVAAIVYDRQRVTSLNADVLDAERTVLLLGTEKGTLKKLLLHSSGHVREYDEQTISALPIEADSALTDDRTHIYLMTAEELLKVPIQSCANYTSCSTCIASGDPYCGWCTLSNSCSTKRQCPYATEEQNAYVPAGSSRCPQVISLSPANVSLQEIAAPAINLQAANLPSAKTGEAYKCIFGNVGVAARRHPGDKFTCDLPERQRRPPIPAGQDSVVVPLKIWSSRSERTIAQTNFTFYNCASHKMCTECVQSRWRCDWCLEDNVCVPGADVCSNQDNQGDEVNTALLANSCPHVDSTSTIEILLAENQPTAITVPVVNVDRLALGASENQVICMINVEGHQIRVRATLSENQKAVVCEEYAYSYDSRLPSIAADLYLQTNKGTIIDKIKVNIYKCQLMAADCSKCLNLDPRFECAWCDGGCEHRRQCALDYYPQTLDVCPAPFIDYFYPSMGPVEGGTRVEITGHDLGLRQADVDGRITVAGVPCTVVEYYASEKIVCITNPSGQGAASGQVEIKLDNNRHGHSQLPFAYVRVDAVAFHPNVGPVSGGTRLIISGEHLTDASGVEVFVGSIPCMVDMEKSTPKSLVCVTSSSTMADVTVEHVTLRLDHATKVIASPFTYTSDPKIASISPSAAFSSGGRMLTVRGSNLNSVQRPLMYLLNRNGLIESEVSICRVVSGQKMECPSPAMLFALSRRRSKRQAATTTSSSEGWTLRDDLKLASSQRLDIGFLMDNVQTVRHLGPEFGLVILPDPVYLPFAEGSTFHPDRPLIIEGNNLNYGNSAKDVQVLLGGKPCNVTLLASSQLICQPKLGLQNDAAAALLVEVRVGNLYFQLGSLSRQDVATASAQESSMALLGGVVGAICSLLFVVILSVAVWWRKKSWLAEKEYRRIQLQMDTLESNVRQECKEAFAELQTDMSDLTNDLVSQGIPYRSRSAYATKVLFKEDQHRCVMQMNQFGATIDRLGDCAYHFEQLLHARPFVMAFVRVLESGHQLPAQEKVYVASLLTAALMSNMQYLTEVVMSLLRRLICRYAQSKQHPQLMLRRTESIVEKMLANWIALCLYDHLQGASGSSLFLLFKALKYQTEKGPIDACTADARYSLSEDRLLREQVDSEPVTLRVLPPNGLLCGQEPVQCRVLSCDAIRQVKSKALDCLYKNVPFSARPSVADVDLEWQSRKGACVLLREHGPSADSWCRLNTVRDYGLPNQALVAVVLKTNSAYTDYSCSHTYVSIDSSSQLIQSNGGGGGSRAAGNGVENCERDDLRFWHLIPPDLRRGAHWSPSTIPEVYLTRSLSTKGTVQQFIDDFVATSLSVGSAETPLVPIKYLFDLLEEEAACYPLADAQATALAWKNNSLPLRFWVNIIKNPDFLFDVEKTLTIDCCLSVIAQAFMDSCSPSEQQLGKDSPCNKLLFARDLPRYRSIFSRFYADVARLPSVTDQELNSFMAPLSKLYAHEWDTRGAVGELFTYALRHQDQIADDLARDVAAANLRLAERFQHAIRSYQSAIA